MWPQKWTIEPGRRNHRTGTRRAFLAILILGSALQMGAALSGEEAVSGEEGLTPAMLDGMTSLPGKLGPLPEVVAPADNPSTPEKIELGRRLFFDRRLSLDRSMSCATCHHPDLGYADGRPRGIGFRGKELGRHSPTVLNTAFNGPQFWDGRAHGLEAQAKGPIMAGAEMNMLTEKNLVRRLRRVADYRRRFDEVFGADPSLELTARAIAAFERTLINRDSRFDRYMEGDKTALSQDEKRGLALYVGRANCSSCHNGSNFTDDKFHNLGVPQVGPNAVDPGRFAITKDEKDRGAFKTPTLRAVDRTAPYMHDGAFASLEEVVDFYDRGGGDTPDKSRLLFPLNLTAAEKRNLIAFLKTLTGPMPAVTAPDDLARAE